MKIAKKWVEYFKQLLNGEDLEIFFNFTQGQPSNYICETPTL